MNIKTLGLVGVLLTVNTPCFSSVDVQAMTADDLVEAAQALEYIGEGGRSERFLDLASQKGSLKAQVELASNIKDLDKRFKEYDSLIKKGSGDALYKKACLLREKSNDIFNREKCAYVRAFQKQYSFDSQYGYLDSLLDGAAKKGVMSAVWWIEDPVKRLLAADKVRLYEIVYKALGEINSDITKSIAVFERLRARPLSSIEYEKIGKESETSLLSTFNSKAYENALYLFGKSCEMGNKDSCNHLAEMYAGSPWGYMDLQKSLSLAQGLSSWPRNLSWAATVGLITKPESGVKLDLGKEFDIYSPIFQDNNDRNYSLSYQYAIENELRYFKKEVSHQRHFLSASKFEVLEEYPDNPKAVELLAYGYLHDGNYERGYYYLTKLFELAHPDANKREVFESRRFLFVMTHEGIGCNKDENKAWENYGRNNGRLYVIKSLKAGDVKNISSPIVREAISNDDVLRHFDLIGLKPKIDNLTNVKYLLKTQEELIDTGSKIFKEFFPVQDSSLDDIFQSESVFTKGSAETKLKQEKQHALRLEKLNELYTIANMLADKGNSKGLHMLGLLQMRMANFDEAMTLFNKAASSGCNEAHSELAKMYFYGLGTEPNVKVAVDQLEAQGLTTAEAYVELAKVADDLFYTDLRSLLLTRAFQVDAKNFYAWKTLVDSFENLNIYGDRKYGLRVLGKACDAAGGLFCNMYKNLKPRN